MPVSYHLTWLLRLCFAFYTFLAVIYTSGYLLLCPFVHDCSAAFGLRIPQWAPDRITATWAALVHSDSLNARLSETSTFEAALPDDPVLDSPHDPVSGLDALSASSHMSWRISSNATSPAFRMPESLFLSKAFSNSMQPMKTIPFFYRASSSFAPDDITITTLITMNRLSVLQKLAARYPGPLSVTLHLPLQPAPLHASLESLHALLRASPALAARADIHLVLSPFPRAFNAWRNLGRLLARTEYVLILDVDFAVCTDWRGPVLDLLRAGGEMARRMREGAAALVVPAFEYVRPEDGTDQETFPRDKAALVKLVKKKQLLPFHASWAQGHNGTDYPRFYSAQPGEVYRVTHYQPAYEPYVIVKRDADGWCDERFTGYGGNKAACLFEMYLSGVSFYVLSDHFLIHQSHAYEEEARRIERKYNRKIYADFKEETCLKYIKRFYDQGILNTTRGHNVQEECKKLKGIGRIVSQMLDGQ